MFMRITAGVLVALAVGLTVFSPAAEPTKANPDAKAMTSTGKAYQPATAIDFCKDLALPFASLETLGVRIEEARRIADPVALASAASYLAASEAASGKQASLTAEVLRKEAVDMVKRRHQSAELKAVAALVANKTISATLTAQADKAEREELQAQEAFKAGDKSRGVWGYLTVRNNTGNTIGIYVNGTHRGYVNPYRDFRFPQPLRHGPTTNTVLMGRSGSRQWGPLYKDNPVGDEIWVLD